MVSKNELTRSIQLALVVGLGASALPTYAVAQDSDEAKELESIVITGSRVRRVDASTASPVFTVERTQIEQTGAATIGEFLQEAPSISGAATNPQVNNGGGTGAATVSLRGLGSNRTLVLINGRRFASGDINAIPINMVERIEVLKDGASAIYGTDAIGGVVNFILRTDYEGFEASGSYGVSSEDDGDRKQANASFGHQGENGNLVFGVKYDEFDEVAAKDRDFSAAPFAFFEGEEFILGSSRNLTGFYSVPRTVATAAGINISSCAGSATNVFLTRQTGRSGRAANDFRCYVGGGPNNDTFNFQAEGNVLLTPQDRYGLFTLGSYDLTENVQVYTELYYNNTQSASTIASLPFDSRFEVPFIDARNVYNPFGVNIPDARLRTVALGPRRTSYETDDFQTVFGFRGTIFESWQYDVNALYGRTKQRSQTTGALFQPAVAAALGPSFDTNPAPGIQSPVCGTPGPNAANPLQGASVIPGCVPIDLFGDQTAANSPLLGALSAISPAINNLSDGKLKMFTANFNGELFELPAGMLSAAVGAEYQKNESVFEPDFIANTDNGNRPCLVTSDYCTSPTAGSFDQKDVYFEVLAPILSDVPYAQSVYATLGWRYSDYSTFGSTDNGKLGLEWRPMDDLLIRATYAEVFRAPGIGELFSGQTENASTFGDPCNGLTAAIVAANPGAARACQNVPTNGTFRQTDTQLSALVGGNPDLAPEQGSAITWGFVYDPNWAEGLSLQVDVWKVYLRDTVGTLGTQNILDQCFATGNEAFCSLFSRNSSGEVIRLFDTNQNIGRIDTDGVDFGALYRFPDTDYGSFRIKFDATYTDSFVNKPIPGVTQDFTGQFVDISSGSGLGHFARWRALSTVGWNYGSWSASWDTRYVHSVIERGDGNTLDVDRRVPSYAKHDFQLSYNVEPLRTTFTLGLDNAFDKQPPKIYTGFNGTTDVRTYDAVGRFYWARAQVRF